MSIILSYLAWPSEPNIVCLARANQVYHILLMALHLQSNVLYGCNVVYRIPSDSSFDHLCL
jgi:hypothetical protein